MRQNRGRDQTAPCNPAALRTIRFTRKCSRQWPGEVAAYFFFPSHRLGSIRHISFARRPGFWVWIQAGPEDPMSCRADEGCLAASPQ